MLNNLRRKRMWLTAAAALLAGLAVFGATYYVKGSDVPLRAQDPGGGPPDPGSMPTPGAPVDTSQPGWFIPYENAERDAQKFGGTLAGITISARATEVDSTALCGGEFRPASPKDIPALLEQGPIPVRLADLPPGITAIGPTEVFTCDGVPFEVYLTLEAKAGTAEVEANGSGLSISRTRGTRELYQPASQGRWSEGTVAGRPAAILGPIVQADGKFIGGCAVAFRDEQVNSLTLVKAPAGSVAFCKSVAEALSK